MPRRSSSKTEKITTVRRVSGKRRTPRQARKKTRKSSGQELFQSLLVSYFQERLRQTPMKPFIDAFGYFGEYFNNLKQIAKKKLKIDLTMPMAITMGIISVIILFLIKEGHIANGTNVQRIVVGQWNTFVDKFAPSKEPVLVESPDVPSSDPASPSPKKEMSGSIPPEKDSGDTELSIFERIPNFITNIFSGFFGRDEPLTPKKPEQFPLPRPG